MRRALQALGTGLSRQAAREEALAGASSRCSSSAPDFAHASGAPLQYYTRKAIISSPSRNAMQSGKGNTAFGVSPTWKIDFEQKSAWANPLMGWTSTADALEQLRVENGMSFYTKEEAVAYCKKFGWDFEVREPQETRRIGTVHYRNPRYAQYADNFSVKRAGMPLGGKRSESVSAGPAPSSSAPAKEEPKKATAKTTKAAAGAAQDKAQ